MKNEKVDTLIIGSGVVAAALSAKILKREPNASILVLEAGVKVPMKRFNLYQDYLVTGNYPYGFCEDYDYPSYFSAGENLSMKNNAMQLAGSRAMMYGGSTAHWGGWSFRFKPEDFRLYSNTGIPNTIDWPFDYEELEPYYCEAEHYIGVSGDSCSDTVPRSHDYPFPYFPYTLEDQPYIEAFESLGWEYNHMPIARHGMVENKTPLVTKEGDSALTSIHAPCKTTGTCKYCPFGARYAAANFLDDMLRYQQYPNFEVRTACIVDHINMDSKQRATGVTYHEKFTENSFTVEAERVIVAAGAIEAAKLLERSTSQWWETGIGNQNGLVGKNFVSHPFVYWESFVKTNPLKLQPEMNFPTLVSRHFDSLEQQAQGKFITVHLDSDPNIAANINNSTTSIETAMQNGVPRHRIDALLGGHTRVGLITQIEVFSELTNFVSNARTLNHLGMRETKVHYVKADNFDDYLDDIQGLLTPAFEAIGASQPIMATDSIRADHAACLTRMSDSPETGVVDKDLKVFGTKNVYVCSNASFSSLSAVNPTLTLTAITLRLADHLLPLIQK